MKIRPVLLLACGLLALAASPASAALQFGSPTLLPHGDPNGTPWYLGGEPSIGFDPNGDHHVYVTAPQRIPSVLGQNAGPGIAYWASDDSGATWPRSGLTGTLNGGGDSDVEVLQDHSVLAADLEAADAAICISTDFAHTFPNCDGGMTTNHQGPENDRQWLTRGPKKGVVYLTYHDFAGGFPIIEQSTDGGNTFAPCATIINPSGPAAQTYTPEGGTLVSKPVIGKDGTIYVEFTTPDQTAPPVGATLDHIYMAVLPQGACGPGAVFTDYTIYQDPGADLGRIFQQTAIDGSGQLYVFVAGRLNASDKGSNLYLFTSKDGAKTWSRLPRINPDGLPANVFPTLAAGQGAGEALLGWFGTATSDDPNNGKDQWRYYAAATYDGGQTFNYTTVSPDPIHYGDICTSGTVCGTGIPGTGNNRNLADFASAGIDPSNGCGAFAIPGDPYNRPDISSSKDNGNSSAYLSLQQDQTTCLTAANAGKAAGAVGAASSAGTGAGASTGTGPTVTNGILSGCADRIAPTSRFRGHPRIVRGRLVFRGTSSDRGCGAAGRGKVAKVRVAVGRRYAHQRCRYLQSNGRFGRLVSCLRTTYLSARGTSTFSLRIRRLRRGRYVAWVRGIDAAGNIERKARTRNLVRFTVR